jgi:hypothetical protein
MLLQYLHVGYRVLHPYPFTQGAGHHLHHEHLDSSPRHPGRYPGLLAKRGKSLWDKSPI